MILIATFYKFVDLPDFREKRDSLWQVCNQQFICGTILLAKEGINGTIAGEPEQVEALFAFLRQDERLEDLSYRASKHEQLPFQRLKIKLKREIVTFGQPQIEPQKQTGQYVEPGAWNQLISDPDVMVIDTRNHYEVGIGSFRGATNPETDTFREFPDYVKQSLSPDKHSKIAMFCTGGIRCEKASAYLLEQGFQEVYHLQGGILNYLEQVSADKSLWEGECFVFDERVAVKQGLEVGSYSMCQACGHPVSQIDQASEFYVPGESCPHCYSGQNNSDFLEAKNLIEARRPGKKDEGNTSLN